MGRLLIICISTVMFILVALTLVTPSVCLDLNTLAQARSIQKRFADADITFEGHDVAKVHLVQGHKERRKRLTKRDLRQMDHLAFGHGGGHLQLDLSSGSKVDMNLRPSGIASSETVVAFRASDGRVERKLGQVDCYYHGEMEDSSGTGWAVLSHCDGVFGFASSPGFEYFIHPVEHRRPRRSVDAHADNNFDVHVMWRRSVSTSDPTGTNFTSFKLFGDYGGTEALLGEMASHQRRKRSSTEPKRLVVEMAMFSDAEYWKKLQALYPGREDDFLLTRLAGSQALYSDSDKVGYDFQIKLKLLEYWVTDPSEYNFNQRFANNIKSSCDYTTKQFENERYDVHAINTGISDWNDGQRGVAYVSGTCSNDKRCFVMKPVDLDSFKGFAHELGHTLGFIHENAAKCPESLKTVGGFMGGGSPYNFSPCMKYQLDKYISSGRGACLFEETHAGDSLGDEYDHLPNVLPGQARTPDGICEILAGKGYTYFQNEKSRGDPVCTWFLCINEDENSPEFGRAMRILTPPAGFPCRDNSFCETDRSCKAWNSSAIGINIDTLKSLVRIPQWSEWSAELSSCSNTCGGGIRTRRRECQYTDLSLAPYCPGMAVKPELCNTEPCPGEPATKTQVRLELGNAVCARFLKNGVKLNLKNVAKAYLPEMSDYVSLRDVGKFLSLVTSRSCLMKCKRDPPNVRGDVDAIMPDGAPCSETIKTELDMKLFNIEMKCTRGLCLEYSDCPNDPLEVKDACGICGGDGSRCVTQTFTSAYNVPRKNRNFLLKIPACSRNIYISLNRRRNPGILLELFNKDSEMILASDGIYPTTKDYEGPEAIPLAGTNWSYNLMEGYLRAPGPLDEPVIIFFQRMGRPLNQIVIRYAEGA